MLSRRSLLAVSAALAASCGNPLSAPSVPHEVELRVAASTTRNVAFGFPSSESPEDKYLRAAAALEADSENQFGPTRGGYRLALRFFDELHPPYATPMSPEEFEEARAEALRAAGALLESLEADLVAVSPSVAHWLGREGLLLPLDRFSGLEEAVVNQEFYPSVVSAYRRNGALYGLPIAARPLMLHYDGRYFAEHGVPTVDASWNWDNLVDSAVRLTAQEEDGSVARWGLIAHLDGILWALWQNEAAVVDPVSLRCQLQDPAAVEALQFLRDLMHRHRVSPPVFGLDLYELLLVKRSLPAMLYDYSPSYFDRGPFRIGPLPQGNIQAVPMRADLGLAIPARTKHAEAAYMALLGLTLALQEEVVIPAGRAAVERLADMRSGLRPAEVTAIQHSLKHGRAEPGPGLQSAVLNEALKRLGRGEDVAAAVNGACALVDEYKEL